MHPWVILSKEEDLPISSNTIKNTITNLSNFSAKDALQIATMSFISNKLADANQKNELKKIFKNFDENGDGVLSYEEFTIGYTKLYGKALSNLEMAKLIEEIDTDKSGKIEFNEFLTATFSKSKNLNEENLREAFNKFDTDNSGKLSIQELLTLFDNNEEYVNELLFKVDENNDGELDFDEFTKLMNIASETDEKRLKKEKKKDKKDKEKSKDEDNKDEDEKDKKKKKKDKEKKKK
jgi:calcium-dependent protein kinase